MCWQVLLLRFQNELTLGTRASPSISALLQLNVTIAWPLLHASDGRGCSSAGFFLADSLSQTTACPSFFLPPLPSREA